jgi:hypothetical protein
MYNDILGRGGARQFLEILGGASRRVRGVRGVRRGGWWCGKDGCDAVNLRGGKRHFRKRTCRSKSRCGGGGDMHPQMFPGAWYRFPDGLERMRRGGTNRVRPMGSRKRPFRKRTCRSKSRCVGGGDIMRNWKRFGPA